MNRLLVVLQLFVGWFVLTGCAASRTPVSQPQTTASLMSAWSELGDDQKIEFAEQRLSGTDELAQLEAISLLRIIRNEQVIPVFVKNLNHPNYEVRVQAASGLAEWGKKAGAAVPALITAIKDEDDSQSIAPFAAAALGAIGDQSAIPALAVLAENRNYHFHMAAASALRQINTPAAVAAIDQHFIPARIAELRSNDCDTRATAAAALGELREANAQATTELAQLLGSGCPRAQQRALIALKNLSAFQAVPSIIPLLRSSSADLQAIAAETLKEFATPEALTAVNNFCRSRRSRQALKACLG